MSALAHIALARALQGEDFYDCASCDANPVMKELLGHDGPPTQFWQENLLTGEPLMRCPLRSVQLADQKLVEEIQRHRFLYRPMREFGVMIAAGGIEDQPARSLDIIAMIDYAEAKSRRKHEELRPKNPPGQ